jgi:hypothetical protein
VAYISAFHWLLLEEAREASAQSALNEFRLEEGESFFVKNKVSCSGLYSLLAHAHWLDVFYPCSQRVSLDSKRVTQSYKPDVRSVWLESELLQMQSRGKEFNSEKGSVMMLKLRFDSTNELSLAAGDLLHLVPTSPSMR